MTIRKEVGRSELSEREKEAYDEMNGRDCVRLLFLLAYVTLKFYCLLIVSVDIVTLGVALHSFFSITGTNFSSSTSSEVIEPEKCAQINDLVQGVFRR